MRGPQTFQGLTFALEHQLLPGLENILLGRITVQHEPEPSVGHRTTFGANAPSQLFLIQQIWPNFSFPIRHSLEYGRVGVKGPDLSF